MPTIRLDDERESIDARQFLRDHGPCLTAQENRRRPTNEATASRRTWLPG